MNARLPRRVVLAGAAAWPLAVARANAVDFPTWLKGLRGEALQKGISSRTFDAALQGVSPQPKILELDRRQPEVVQSLEQYLATRLTPTKIDNGRRRLADQGELLERVRKRFGVPPSVVVALWGMESDYGRFMGDFSVVASLATLAYDGRRSAYFRDELIEALRILERGRLSRDALRGSWAGAMGQCQFMPSTFLSYAVDFDGDGRRDIWNNRADVLGSIANYLARLGWRGNESWGREVAVPGNLDTRVAGLESRRPLAEWMRMGVRSVGAPLTGREAAEASLLLPDGLGGRALLVFDNFRATMRWNKSVKFAASVGMIADGIDRG